MCEYTITGNTMRFSKIFEGPLEPYYEIMRYNRIIILIFDNDVWRFRRKTIKPIPNITYIKLNPFFNNPIELGKCMKGIVFGNSFDNIFESNKNMLYLTFGHRYTKPLKLTKHIQHLVLEGEFDHHIDLNKNITVLLLGDDFDHPIVLNKKITHLRIGGFFNQTLILSKNIMHLFIKSFISNQQPLFIPSPNICILEIRTINHNFIDNLSNGLKKIIFAQSPKTIINVPCCAKIVVCQGFHPEKFPNVMDKYFK